MSLVGCGNNQAFIRSMVFPDTGADRNHGARRQPVASIRSIS